jgi:hypothetical protein
MTPASVIDVFDPKDFLAKVGEGKTVAEFRENQTPRWEAADSTNCKNALDVPVVVDFVGKACHPDSDRGHTNNVPSQHRPPQEFRAGNNPTAKADYAGRDQICDQSFHTRHS